MRKKRSRKGFRLQEIDRKINKVIYILSMRMDMARKIESDKSQSMDELIAKLSIASKELEAMCKR